MQADKFPEFLQSLQNPSHRYLMISLTVGFQESIDLGLLHNKDEDNRCICHQIIEVDRKIDNDLAIELWFLAVTHQESLKSKIKKLWPELTFSILYTTNQIKLPGKFLSPIIREGWRTAGIRQKVPNLDNYSYQIEVLADQNSLIVVFDEIEGSLLAFKHLFSHLFEEYKKAKFVSYNLHSLQESSELENLLYIDAKFADLSLRLSENQQLKFLRSFKLQKTSVQKYLYFQSKEAAAEFINEKVPDHSVYIISRKMLIQPVGSENQIIRNQLLELGFESNDKIDVSYQENDEIEIIFESLKLAEALFESLLIYIIRIQFL